MYEGGEIMSKKIKPKKMAKGVKVWNEWHSKKATFPGSPQLQKEVIRVGERVENEMADPNRTGPVIGAVVGSVQSGKTASMVGLQVIYSNKASK